MHHRLLIAAAFTLLFCVSGCGKKGALYLPPPAQIPPTATTSP